MTRTISDELADAAAMAHFISTNSKADVFFQYSPHCNQVDIILHALGWVKGAAGNPVHPCEQVNGTIYLDDSELLFGVLNTLSVMVDDINKENV